MPVLVAVRAKPNRNASSILDREFSVSFLDVSLKLISQSELVGTCTCLFLNQTELKFDCDILHYSFNIVSRQQKPMLYFLWLQVLNQAEHTGRFNFTTEFPYYREVYYKPDLRGKNFGKNLVFDMDMSAGDFLSLFYLLKLPVEDINLKVNWPSISCVPSVYA